MTDCISREVAMSMPWANGQYDHEHANEHFICGLETYKEWLEYVPAADVRPVVRGEWLEPDDDYGYLVCSVCEERSPNDERWSFCPNCGADMRR